jgi:hypothetical protein
VSAAVPMTLERLSGELQLIASHVDVQVERMNALCDDCPENFKFAIHAVLAELFRTAAMVQGTALAAATSAYPSPKPLKWTELVEAIRREVQP